MAENTGQHLLKDKDFVDVVDQAGNDLGYRVPKHWGKDELPPGVSKKSRSSSGSSSGSGSSTPAADPNAEPAGNAGREAWADYAVKVKGAKPEDLVDGDGKELGRDELKAKFGQPAS